MAAADRMPARRADGHGDAPFSLLLMIPSRLLVPLRASAEEERRCQQGFGTHS